MLNLQKQVCILVNEKNAEKYIGGRIHKKIFDMCLVCTDNGENFDLKEYLNYNLDELVIKTLNQAINEIISQYDEQVEDCKEIIIITNKNLNYGAINIFNEDVLKNYNNYYVIPSSVHEVLLIPINFIDCDDIKEILLQMNETLKYEEKLSDNIYIIDNGELKIAK